jgi:gliding motility-associated lipoprotein GldJ
MKANKNVVINVVLGLVILLGVSSCSKQSSSKGGSTATGWKINDKKGGFQYNSKFKKQATAPGLVMVEGGTFTMGKVQDDVMHDWNNTPNQQHVASFYMDETEVTNLMYMEYLDWLKRVFPPEDDNYKNIYPGASPDTLVWRNRLGYNETYTNNYLRHPAYASYPVVGVNWIQAVEFSKWRTDRVNENTLETEGYLKKDAKIVDVKAESTFSTETYLNAPSKTFGGDDKIVLKGRKNSMSKPIKVAGTKGQGATTKNPTGIYAQRSSGLILPEYRPEDLCA